MRPLLGKHEPAAFELLNAEGKSDIVLVCDHASNRVPEQLQDLGLSTQTLSSHIAWDIGALWVARYLSERLDAPLLFSNYSRLVIDCNRCPERDDLVPDSSAGIMIPGNQKLLIPQASCRREALFDPYHKAIDGFLHSRAHRTTMLLSIHSFTPVLGEQVRPWPIGVCYETPSLMSKRWFSALQVQLVRAKVGDNEPYTVEPGLDYTLPQHGGKHDLAAIMLEIRQNEISTPAAAKSWGASIAAAWELNR